MHVCTAIHVLYRLESGIPPWVETSLHQRLQQLRYYQMISHHRSGRTSQTGCTHRIWSPIWFETCCPSSRSTQSIYNLPAGVILGTFFCFIACTHSRHSALPAALFCKLLWWLYSCCNRTSPHNPGKRGGRRGGRKRAVYSYTLAEEHPHHICTNDISGETLRP